MSLIRVRGRRALPQERPFHAQRTCDPTRYLRLRSMDAGQSSQPAQQAQRRERPNRRSRASPRSGSVPRCDPRRGDHFLCLSWPWSRLKLLVSEAPSQRTPFTPERHVSRTADFGTPPGVAEARCKGPSKPFRYLSWNVRPRPWPNRRLSGQTGLSVVSCPSATGSPTLHDRDYDRSWQTRPVMPPATPIDRAWSGGAAHHERAARAGPAAGSRQSRLARGFASGRPACGVTTC